jgi:hypothetical protein
MDELDNLTDRLQDMVDGIDSQKPELSTTLETARSYLIAGLHKWPYDLAQPIQDDIVLAVAADLWTARTVHNGVMQLPSSDGITSYRVSPDPLRAAWPKLRAAGVLAGLGIA